MACDGDYRKFGLEAVVHRDQNEQIDDDKLRRDEEESTFAYSERKTDSRSKVGALYSGGIASMEFLTRNSTIRSVVFPDRTRQFQSPRLSCLA